MSRARPGAWGDLPADVRLLFADADHVDVKTGQGELNLREFVAAAMSWQPAWLKALFRAREVLARLLRLDRPDVPAGARLRPEDVSFAPGTSMWFFTVTAGAEDRYIVLKAADNHLTGYCAIVSEPVTSGPGPTRFRVVTVVRYHRWTGRAYFAVVRPFHHLVVTSMIRAAVAAGPPYGDSRS
ncbi:MAG: DUF2867 domain-containing protein [Jiangellaceae bacterium]